MSSKTSSKTNRKTRTEAIFSTRRTTSVTTVCGALLCALLAAPMAEAHRLGRGHHHRHRSALIVVGKPRPVKRVAVIDGRPAGVLDLNVEPRATEVWVDGTRRGTCADFDGFPAKLTLTAGLHEIELVTPDGLVVEREVRVVAGREINVGLDLR